MVNWDFLIDDRALASVLPREYAQFARPVRDALSVFLTGLPDQHQDAMLRDQVSLPPDASVSQRLTLLARGCPALHKLGQILARDRRLMPEFRQQLQQLESPPPSTPLAAIDSELTSELGALDQLGVTLEPTAIAEASVAVVIGFQQATSEGCQNGVFKLLKPGIEERLDQELELAEKVGAHLDQRCEDLQIPQLDYRESFAQVRDKLQCEVQLDREQRHLARASVFYADEPRVQIPNLLDHCTPRVTSMQRVTGGKITDHGLDSLIEKRRLAELVIQSLIARPVFSKNDQAFFHCDPHAGNLFLTEDGRLAILDWSLVGTLDEVERVAIVQIMLGALSLHAEWIVRILTALAERPPDTNSLRSVVEAWLRRIRYGQFPGLAWLVGLLDEAVATAGLRVGTDLMLFRKTLHTLDGVLLDIDDQGSRMDGVLFGEFLRNLANEWPRRWATCPDSREFATRLSNLDLIRWTLEFPATTARFWVEQIRDLFSNDAPLAIAGKSKE